MVATTKSSKGKRKIGSALTIADWGVRAIADEVLEKGRYGTITNAVKVSLERERDRLNRAESPA